MKFFPESTLHQLEFDKVKDLLAAHCSTEYAKTKALSLRIHTRKDFIEIALQQANEYKTLLQSGGYFPNDFVHNISKELKLLGIPGATLSGEQFLHIRKLTVNAGNIFRWFTVEMRETFPGLARVIENNYYEKVIIQLIDEVLDGVGVVKDTASEELADIRQKLYRKRTELRRVFDRIVQKLNKEGYLADIEESFMNGRRVLAVFAEQKRKVKGVLHSESDSRRTSFIEPEETTELNNEIFSLEYEEQKEVHRILRVLTQQLSIYAVLLKSYYDMAGEYDLIRAKAKFAIDIKGSYPMLHDRAHVKLITAYHPLLLLYNTKNNKPTVPIDLTLDDQNSILVISGPNAGGKTVTLKTVGLTQVMMQAGLLVSVSPDSEMGIFKQLLIHIGDTQSIEFELSTYSSHLKNMKYFIEHANGKTLFFIDELGSGSDPNLGGAFAEVIMEELAFKHAFGIVTTHYLNLKVMANKVKGIINGAMQFDEKNLLPLYKLQIGKPGSSYTFSIAERIGLDKKLLAKARTLVDEEHFRLDKLLNRTEQDLQKIDKEKAMLNKLLAENEKLKKEMQQVLQKELHKQEIERLQQQNKISEEKINYLKDMERRLKAMVIEWRKTDDKASVVKTIHALLFNQKERKPKEHQSKKGDDKYEEVVREMKVGDKVKMKKNRQVGVVKELRGKKAVIQVGVIPITVALEDLVILVEKPIIKATAKSSE
ncbi:DNA mismatch repair protein MutS [Ferruginibacter lapsinanis]|uniref:endonuclease MutS2 n=1 Tax=Ferruginibacter lapsinanis TaxID=563172 RepID=UPI001E4F5EB3|nr:MutS2/Smr-associated SH3 domain-containing protein [Ferruginibacter lapsinanis]UEG48951.1 DNA mismatch repair protein MutS [Ferruginibacter lapsinanis]